jgi:hypothetical protein
MIVDMCILSHKTQSCLMFGHVVDVGVGKRRGLPVLIVIHKPEKNNFVVVLPILAIMYSDSGTSLIQFSQKKRQRDHKICPKSEVDIISITKAWRFGLLAKTNSGNEHLDLGKVRFQRCIWLVKTWESCCHMAMKRIKHNDTIFLFHDSNCVCFFVQPKIEMCLFLCLLFSIVEQSSTKV